MTTRGRYINGKQPKAALLMSVNVYDEKSSDCVSLPKLCVISIKIFNN